MTENFVWKLNQRDCTGCGICADVCSFEAIIMPRTTGYPMPVEGTCTGCLDCVQECPFDAIEVALSAASLQPGPIGV